MDAVSIVGMTCMNFVGQMLTRYRNTFIISSSAACRHLLPSRMSLIVHPTKVSSPPAPAKPQADQGSWVARPALINQLQSAPQGKPVLLYSPNGSGKTSLLQSWLLGDASEAGVLTTAWFSLDEGDNDPVRFLSGIIHAIQPVHPPLGATVLTSLKVPRPPDVFIELSALLSELAQLEQDLVLVLDDYEAINSPRIHQALVFLAANLPPNIRLVLSCGADLPQELEEAWQQQGWQQLGFRDLQLSSSEVAAVFKFYARVDLSSSQLELLTRQSQGLVIAVQLVGLALLRHPDPPAFWVGLDAQPAPALTYLVEQTLMQQMDPVREFLLCTAILERFNGQLADRVMRASPSGLQAEGRGRVTLEHLSKNRLLTTALDSSGAWYRYQPEFARLLLEQLQQRYPGLLNSLHLRASDGYELSGDLDAAVRHALAAGDEERASILIEVNVLSVVGMGQLNSVLTWLGKLSAGVILLRPWLCLAEAWAIVHEGWEQGVETLLATVEAAVQVMPDPSAQRARGHIAAIRSQVPAASQSSTHLIDLYRQALELLPPQDRWIRCYIATQLGISLRQRGLLTSAAEAFSEATYCANQAQDNSGSILASCLQADLHLVEGLLQKVLALSEEALNQAEIHRVKAGYLLPQTSLAHIFAGIVLLERDELELAQSHLEQSLELARVWGRLDVLALGQFILAAVLNARGNGEAARVSASAGMRSLEELMEHMERLPQRATSFLVLQPDLVEAWFVRLQISWGDTSPGRDWLERCGYQPDDPFGIEQAPIYITVAQALLSLDRLLDARRLVRRLVQLCESAGAVTLQVQALVLQTQLLQLAQDYPSALASLKRAFLLAENESMLRVFIDLTGAPDSAHAAAMSLLIKRISEGRSGSVYAKTVLTSLERQAYRSTHAENLASLSASLVTRPQPVLDDALSEPFTDREKQVLRSLGNYLSVVDIASELSLSSRTVDAIVRNIYLKLGVRDARQAVQRARELRII